MAKIIIKNNISKAVKELDKNGDVSSISSDVAIELEKKIEDILDLAIKRAKANNRRTLFGRDL